MTALLWDQIGQRYYEAGVDKGVLYMPDGHGVSWNGLISVTEKVTGGEGSPIYFDGVKFANVIALGEFAASLKAYTYPDEFIQFEGILEVGNGLFVTNQQTERFGLSYRTKIGNDLEGDDLGYKIHVLYNLSAVPAEKNFATFMETSNAIQFEWSITAIPGEVPGFQPTAHLIFDTRFMGDLILQDIENTLYGDELNDARLPPISVLTGLIGDWVIIRIIDNLDGTWTAIGPDNYISMLDATTFQIVNANAVYVDGDTYMISDLTY
jgi:hypothetical protein